MRIRNEVQDQYLRMNTEFEFDSKMITIRYRINSLIREKIAVFDGITRLTAEGYLKWDRFLAYVSFNPPGTLAIKRVIPPLPTLKCVEFAYVPFAHLVHEREHQGEIRLSVPVYEYNPYYPPPKKPVYFKVTAQVVELVLEYAIVDSDTTLIEIEGLAGLYRVKGPSMHLRQKIRTIANAPKPGIPVWQRQDTFERV